MDRSGYPLLADRHQALRLGLARHPCGFPRTLVPAGEPAPEVWMGAHPRGFPVADLDGERESRDLLIQQDA